MQHIINWSIEHRRICFALTCCVILFFYAMKVTYYDHVEMEPIIKGDEKKLVKSEDISCYYINDGDVFPSADDPSFSPKDNSIFFIESACKEKMTMMQACVIESAAVSNPESNIYVLFSYSITHSLIKGYFEQILNHPNVYAARIHITQYAGNMALEPILLNEINKSRHPIEDLTSILKIVTLHKWGGIAMDNDMMAVRSFENVPKNWLVKKSNGISTGILSFAKDNVGGNSTSEIMKEFAKTYDPKRRDIDRLNTVIIQVLERMCPDLITSKSADCNGIKMLSEDLFYPIKMPSPAPYVDEGTESIEMEIPHTFHIRNMDFSSYPSEEWPSENLARIFCPSIFESNMKIK